MNEIWRSVVRTSAAAVLLAGVVIGVVGLLYLLGDLLTTWDSFDGLGVAVGALLLAFGALVGMLGHAVRQRVRPRRVQVRRVRPVSPGTR